MLRVILIVLGLWLVLIYMESDYVGFRSVDGNDYTAKLSTGEYGYYEAGNLIVVGKLSDRQVLNLKARR